MTAPPKKEPPRSLGASGGSIQTAYLHSEHTPDERSPSSYRVTNEQERNTFLHASHDRLTNARARLTSASITDLDRLADATGVTFTEGETATLRRVASILKVGRHEAARIVIAACGIFGRGWRAAP